MRLQLDSAVSGSGLTRSNEVAPPNGTGYDSSRIGGTGTDGDTIRISGPSSALRSLSAERTARIQQLTLQVQASTYNISSSLIGQAIVAQAASAPGSEPE